jgi:hypothetical protein
MPVVDHLDRVAAARASRLHGVIGHGELLELGMGRHAINHRLKTGRLHRMHRGVYLVGHLAAPPMAWEAAAVLATGPGALISHCSAGHLWKLLPRPGRGQPRPHERPERHDVDVTVVARSAAQRDGIHVHRAPELDPRDIRRIDGIPLTSPARTLLDLTAVLTTRGLEQVVAEGYAHRLFNRSALTAVLARYPRRHGARRLREILEADTPLALTRSEAEERLLALIRAAQLPRPEVNARVGPYEVDFLWRRQRLVVEVDGYAFHSSRTAF